MNFYATLKKQNVLGRPEVSQKASGRAGSGVEVDGLRLGVEAHWTGLRVQWGKSSWIFLFLITWFRGIRKQSKQVSLQ